MSLWRDDHWDHIYKAQYEFENSTLGIMLELTIGVVKGIVVLGFIGACIYAYVGYMYLCLLALLYSFQ